MIVFSDILDKIFTYFIDSGEKVYIIEKGIEEVVPKIQYNKYLIRPPNDYLNIREYNINIQGNNYELVAILSGDYITKEEAEKFNLNEGAGGHYWLDIYDKLKNKFTMINDLKELVITDFERNKNSSVISANAWLIYEKI